MSRAGHRLGAALAGIAVVASALTVAGCASDGTGGAHSAPDAALRNQIAAVDAAAFREQHPELFVDVSTDPGFESVSVMNYDPAELPPPARQDVVGYGRVGLSEETLGDTVYSVLVVDGERAYSAEFDAVTREQVHEEGSWFLPADR